MGELAYYGGVQPSEYRRMDDYRDALRLLTVVKKLHLEERKEQIDFDVELLKHEVKALSSLITSLCSQLARLIR
jgi:hypothetical protein